MLGRFKDKAGITAETIRTVVGRAFDEEYYRRKYASFVGDVNYLDHYLTQGAREGLDPTAWFSTSKYLFAYPDVAETNINPFFHYLYFGKSEGRDAGLVQGLPGSSLRDLVKSGSSSDEEYRTSQYYIDASSILGDLNTFSPIAFERFSNWTKMVPKSAEDHPNVKAFLETAKATGTGRQAFVQGWVIRRQNSFIWFETNQGHILPLSTAFFQYRDDVFHAFEAEMAEALPNSGFVQALTACDPNSALKMFALSSKGAHLIAEVEVGRVEASPKALAEKLFSIETPMSLLSQRFTHVDISLIGSLIEHKNHSIKSMPHEVHQFGKIESPDVSIIIPLYGRMDFVEAQMQCFAKDSYISHRAELIYVLDDSTLVEPFKKASQDIFRLYKIPFKVIWGGVNRGFSGANNLGAQYASAMNLLFLNSDAFPNHSGWIESLTEELNRDDKIGVVAPRLVFADGAIQHAGMQFVYRHDLAIWTNHHPQMGVEPELDEHQSATTVPAVTGACMLLSRHTFELVKGWDEGYLIGDFEDSDLCLKIRDAGMKCVYVPSVQLTHLERQSFNLSGTPGYRTKVVIYNATRHQNRWSSLLQESGITE